VRLSVIAASVSSWPWMRIDTGCLVPWVVSVRFAENGPLDATAWINSPEARPTAVPAIPRAPPQTSPTASAHSAIKWTSDRPRDPVKFQERHLCGSSRLAAVPLACRAEGLARLAV
jgi:hypothetical protein